ncbi:DIMBOA UDP-glucosyltransferase BX8 [Zea mays]|uniref:UDP-glucosyltransferase n=1 Tax=Zea mays TaxID=4577 RepID=A0A1D6HWJ1_MAIZE|nr:DIMBOA UDP-glucosyltransferase BX8 [Zea mays]ONM52593.1 UDP-glucosyltransferase [Zea mays]
MAGDDGRAPSGLRVVMFPFPFWSHINQMLQLGKLLRARGLGVTMLHTDFNAPDPALHPDITFVSIRESLPAEVVANPDMVEQMMQLNAVCEAPFQAALAGELLARGTTTGGPREVACVVVDGQWYKMLGAATRVAVPALVLRADGAATLLSMLATPRLRADGYLPIKEERLDEVVPGLEPLRVRDLIRVDGSDDETVLRFITRNAEAVRASSSGVVLNTFEGIEGAALAKIRRELSGRPVFAVGPLHLASPDPAAAAAAGYQDAPDPTCLAWLDARPPRSVLYVSMGSVARVDRAVFEETAWALAGSGVPFLWVLRRGSVRGADEEVPPVPEELRETVRHRGKIVAWAPQREVLAHPAVGGFWTHCGWKSMVEAISEGVPMLVQPCFAEQIVNARYVTHQWGIGYEVGKPLERTAMAKAARKLMAGELGPQGPRERARLLKAQAKQCVAERGGISLALDGLVDYICSL